MSANRRLSVFVASLLLAVSATTIALPAARPATTDSANATNTALPFGALHWRMIGPFRAGRTLAVTGVPGQPTHFYMGSVDGGVWETHDTGRTWHPIFDNEPVQSIGAIAVAPSDPNVIYVGTGESDMRSDIVQGDGMYKSVDAGKTWTHIGLADSQQIAIIRVDPHNPNRVFVAALGHPYGPNAQRGVFRSLDGGKTWKKVLGPNADTGAIDIIFKPGDANVIYAALWQTRRPPWSV
ncbi:MAG: WD40/YVTN/BNR-like repeat-containing protein, partial [Rhodanobacteraceae bacterium]